jgi:hypothetical protein
MPTDVAVVVAAIVLAFLTFAGALAWSDYHSRNCGWRAGK